MKKAAELEAVRAKDRIFFDSNISTMKILVDIVSEISYYLYVFCSKQNSN